jgi:phosphotransferase system HPr (HPr) family protein
VRPASAFAQAAMKFSSKITVLKDGVPPVNGKTPLGLLTLAALQGTRLVIRAEGDDAEKAVESLAALVENRFGMREDD